MFHAANASDLPGLAMPEPHDRRRILISSALSALFHMLLIGAIAYVGYLARQVIEEVIPVTLLNAPIELPGSNQSSPLPVPKLLSAPMANAAPLAMMPADLSAVPAPIVATPSLDLSTPKSLDLAKLTSVPLAVQADTRPTPSAADISAIEPLEVSAADLIAPKVDLIAPKQTASRSAANLAAPKAFDSVSQLNATQYKGAVRAVPTALTTMTVAGAEGAGPFVATGVSEQYMAAGGAGGDPNTMGSVPCLQSAFVQRYLDEIKRRTYARWEVPIDSSPEDFVQFSVAVDHSGSIAKLEMVDSSGSQFAESGLLAFESASPFPPLNDNNRCLTEKTFRLTFRNPERP